MGNGALHIVMLPWLAFGHMIPFLHLAVALASAGLRVSFLCTPRNIRRLPKVPDRLTDLITFVELPLPPVEGLPDHAEATVDVAPDQVQHLKKAYDLLQDPVRRFIAASSPDWIIHDFLPYWAANLAVDSGLPSVLFFVYSAAVVAFLGLPEASSEDWWTRWWPSPESMTSKPKWVPFPSTVAFKKREAEGFHAGAFSVNASGVSDADRYRLAAESCQAVAVRSWNEYEGEYLGLLGRMFKKPVIPVGVVLVPPASAQEVDGWSGIFRWLDGWEPKTVVFVCFGSEYKMTEDEVHELAHGLELSDLPFLWVLRRPDWVTGDGDDEALPRGFTGRTEGRGLVSFGWAPQLEILAHPAIGGSLFHSGWGSIIETLCYGHAMVVLPSVFDQGLNARLLVERGLAVEVERGDDGLFKRDEIARALRVAMVLDEGEGLRVKAKEVGAVFADQVLHERYVRAFIDYLGEISQQSAT